MNDPTPYLELAPAPRAIFDRLNERADSVRFYIPNPNSGASTADSAGDAAGTPSAWTPITWREHAAEVRAVACWLHSLDFAPQTRAAIFAPNRVEWLSAACGVQSAAGAMVPIYASCTADQAGYVVAHSDAEVVFVDTPALLHRVFEAWSDYGGVRALVLLDDGIDWEAEARAHEWSGGDAPSEEELAARFWAWKDVLSAGAEWDATHPAEFHRRLHAIDMSHLGVMLYTSGTSGRPKGVPLTHANVATNGADWMRIFHPLVEEGDVDLLWLPFSHVFGFGEASIGNALGWQSYLCTPADVLRLLPEVRPTVLMSVPAYWEKLATLAAQSPAPCDELQRITGGRLRFCLSGGAGLKVEVKQLFRDCGLLIMEGYGLTECSPTLTLNRPDDFRFDSVGKPLPSVELVLAEDGEILARGPNVFRGYHKQPDATAEVFTEDGFFMTGDVGRWTEDGFLQIVDRKKDILVTAGGKNVPPANIEQLFQDDPYVSFGVVYGEGRKYLTAGLWMEPLAVQAACGSTDPHSEAVRALLQASIDRVNARVAHHETIRKFFAIPEPLTVESGLITPTLKVKRKAVWAQFAAEFEELYA